MRIAVVAEAERRCVEGRIVGHEAVRGLICAVKCPIVTISQTSYRSSRRTLSDNSEKNQIERKRRCKKNSYPFDDPSPNSGHKPFYSLRPKGRQSQRRSGFLHIEQCQTLFQAALQ